MKEYKAAIIGCGGRGRGHAAGYQKAEGVTLLAAADIDKSRAKKFAEDYGIEAFFDAPEMIEKVKPDIVSIVTLEGPRPALTEMAADLEVKAVMAEKPMAATLEGAYRMVEACEKKGTVLTVSHQMRFDPAFVKAKEAVDAKEIGEPYFIRGCCQIILMGQGPHIIDMILWMSGDAEVDWVMAQVDDIQEGAKFRHPAPGWTVGYIAFKNGIRAVIESGPRTPLIEGIESRALQKRVIVLGTDGITDSIVANRCRILSGKKEGWQEFHTGIEGWNAATTKFIEEIVEVLNHGGEHRNNARVSLRGFSVIQGLCQSALSGGVVSLPLPRDAEPLQELMKRAK